MKNRCDSRDISDIVRTWCAHVWNLQQQTFEIIWRDLIEQHFNVQRRRWWLFLQREVPHRSAEDQVEWLVGLEELSGDIEDVLVAA